MPWRCWTLAVRAPPEWKLRELKKCRLALNHATQAHELGIGVGVSTTAEDLPTTIVFVVRDAKHWPILQDVHTTNGGNVLWVREGPLVAAEIVDMLAHMRSIRLTFEFTRGRWLAKPP